MHATARIGGESKSLIFEGLGARFGAAEKKICSLSTARALKYVKLQFFPVRVATGELFFSINGELFEVL